MTIRLFSKRPRALQPDNAGRVGCLTYPAGTHSSGGRTVHGKPQHNSTAINAGSTYRRAAGIRNFGGTHFPRRMSSLDARVQPSKQPRCVFFIRFIPRRSSAEIAHEWFHIGRSAGSVVEE